MISLIIFDKRVMRVQTRPRPLHSTERAPEVNPKDFELPTTAAPLEAAPESLVSCRQTGGAVRPGLSASRRTDPCTFALLPDGACDNLCRWIAAPAAIGIPLAVFIFRKGAAMNRPGTLAFSGIILSFIILAAYQCPAGPLPIQEWEEEYWQQRADCEISVLLDSDTRMLTGEETISYRNNSPDTLEWFYLHLYPNAYREKSSQLIRDFMQGTLYFFIGLPGPMRGWIEATSLKVDGIDTEFSVEGTILSAGFPRPLLPGGEAKIYISFEEKIRRRIGRAGYSGSHFDIAQWYPKMAVYDREGWHPDQFRIGEFYGEFGTFDVHIELPEGFVVAATGLPVSGDPGWKKNKLGIGEEGGRPHGMTGEGGAGGGELKTKKLHFRAENVHDFAWCADPTLVLQDTTWHGVKLMSVFRSWNRSWADSVLARGLRALAWLEETTGPCPYPAISIVDSPTHGGMEYPMLVMNGSTDEDLILHELAHIYYYGALANNERAEAWMDEGFAQYMTFWYAHRRHGPFGGEEDPRFPYSLFPRRKMYERIAAPVIDRHRTGFAERVAKPVHEFRNGYRLMVYVKAPLFLRALHYTVGDENFRSILHTYFDRWKFKHVNKESFLSVCEEVSGMDLREFFTQWLNTTKSCDYSVERFDVERTQDGFMCNVRVERKGEMMMPLRLVFRMRDGDWVEKRIDGFLRTIDESYTLAEEPVSLEINPDNEILDIHMVDNYAPRRRGLALDLPFNEYHPPGSYQFRIVPIGFYNDIDGGKAGLRLRGSYDDLYRKFTLQSLYGFESGSVDFYGSFEHPLWYLGRDASLALEGYYREGRQGAVVTINKIRRESLYSPLAQHMTFSAFYQEITDKSYIFEHTYEEGRNLRVGMTIATRPRTDLFTSSLFAGVDRSLWGSEFNYERFTMKADLRPARRFTLPLKPYMRFFLGYSSIDPPLQERFNLAGAGSLEKEAYFWLRSVGAFPKGRYNNFHVPGDANLRGYYDGDYSFKRIFASNLELQLPFPLPIPRHLSRKLDRRLYLFYDWGKVYDESPLEALPPAGRGGIDAGLFDDILYDSGFGIRLWRITAEFPIYISHPVLTGDEEKWDFRWTVGLRSLF